MATIKYKTQNSAQRATQGFGSGDAETNSFQQRKIETNTLHEEHHE